MKIAENITSVNISQPKPFKCSLKPRSDQSVSLIRSVMDEHPFKTGDSEILKSL